MNRRGLFAVAGVAIAALIAVFARSKTMSDQVVPAPSPPPPPAPGTPTPSPTPHEADE